MQNEALQPLADDMFGAATGAFSTLAGISASAGAGMMDVVEGSMLVEPDVVSTLTRVPSSGLTFVTRFVKSDIGRVVEMMLGTAGSGGEMDAMQLSIVAETVAQIATAMGEALATHTGISSEGIQSNVVSDATDFPVPPFATAAAPVTVGDGLATQITLYFDGVAMSKMDLKTNALTGAAAEPTPPAAPAASRGRGPSEGQAAQFTPMQPTPLRAAPPGQSNLDLVHDVPLEISAVLGQTELSLRDVVSMQPGSVFELDKLSTEPIDLYVNNILIARGEVVVVDDKFAVKISELNPVVDRV